MSNLNMEQGYYMLQNLVPFEKETANVVMEFTKLHSILGHPINATLKETANQMQILC
jgi:hypothetical protein